MPAEKSWYKAGPADIQILVDTPKLEVTSLSHGTVKLSELKGKIVLVDFWATWCGPCRQMTPIIDQLADEYQGKVKIGKLNVDENGQTAMRYQVRGIPTMLLSVDRSITDEVRAPRTAYYNGEFGCVAGRPNWREYQLRVLDESLRWIDSPESVA